jgi:hypothetical protein
MGSNQKNKKDFITSFSELTEKAEDLKLGDNLWSEVICYLKGIRLSNSAMKNVYLSCPHCKKKIADENSSVCQYCTK